MQGGKLVAVVHDLDGTAAALAEAANLIQRERRVSAVDMADHVRIGLEHDVGVDEAGAGNRGAAGVDRALNAVGACPTHHPSRFIAGLDAAKTDLAQRLDSGTRELAEI